MITVHYFFFTGYSRISIFEGELPRHEVTTKPRLTMDVVEKPRIAVTMKPSKPKLTVTLELL